MTDRAEQSARSTAKRPVIDRRMALRILWFAVAALYLGANLVALPAYLRQLSGLTGVALNGFGFGADWTPAQLEAALQALHLTPTVLTAFHLATDGAVLAVLGGMGLLVARRRWDEMMGWYTSLLLVCFGLIFSGSLSALSAVFPVLARPLSLVTSLPWLGYYAFFFVFPNGRFTPRWTLWAVPALAAFVVALTFVFRFDDTSAVLFIPLFFGLAIYAQGYRYLRVSSPGERQQTKWLLVGVVVFMLDMLFTFAVIPALFPVLRQPGPARLAYQLGSRLWLSVAGFVMIPLGIGLAILRYRLWDIDVVIRRTVVYSVVTGVLAATFYGIVVLLQRLFTVAAGQQSPVAIVISTLAIAALFSPLRRRVQDFVDRRFYRRKYDAQQVLARFSTISRDETDLAGITRAIELAANETMQPATVQVWLARAAGPRDDRSSLS